MAFLFLLFCYFTQEGIIAEKLPFLSERWQLSLVSWRQALTIFYAQLRLSVMGLSRLFCLRRKMPGLKVISLHKNGQVVWRLKGLRVSTYAIKRWS